MKYYPIFHHQQLHHKKISHVLLMPFPLTNAIYSAAVSTKCPHATLQFVPDHSFLAVEVGDTCEIGILKKTYLAVFSEGHAYLAERLAPEEAKTPFSARLPLLCDPQLAYMATNALLATTNEHLTAWRVHREAVGELYKQSGVAVLQDDFRFCLALATSRLARINKSSTLWHWLRQLAAILVFRTGEIGVEAFASGILRSMELHLANYSAAYTLQWVFDVGLVLGISGALAILPLLRAKCRANLHDTSLWTALAHVSGGSETKYSVHHYRHLQQQNEALFGADRGPQGNIASASLGSCGRNSDTLRCATLELEHDLAWLLAVECLVELPYRVVLTNLRRNSWAKQEIDATLVATKARATANPVFCRRLEWASRFLSDPEQGGIVLYTGEA